MFCAATFRAPWITPAGVIDTESKQKWQVFKNLKKVFLAGTEPGN